jgi:hypothetical protein
VADVQGQDGEGGEAEVTETAFGRLLYTDCAPGTGRSAGGGFQVQAQSPGVDSQQASFAVGWLLYEVQNAWLAAGRPVADFPPGFAHAGAEGYGTAQGRYVGKEAVGGRMGNHLADCLLTHDPERYGTIRPAQLWQSPLWRADPWPTRDCPDFDGDLEIGPLNLETVTNWAREQVERGPALARLLSVLEDPKGQRVVIVSADADEAMRWIAAATLLLAQREALQVSFKVFSGAPLRAQQRVVAATPEVNPDLRPGAGLGVFVLDAATGRSDEAATTARAEFLVAKLTGDADPYDIVDAIDLASALGAGLKPGDASALQAAWTLTRPDDLATDPAALSNWLRQASQALLREHGPAITEALLSGPGRPPGDLLRWLDAQVTAGELEFDHNVIRTRLLDSEIGDALADGAIPDAGLPNAALTDQTRRDAESALTSALLRGTDGKIDQAEADRLLRLARRHGISLEPPSPSVRKFVTELAWAWLSSEKPGDPRTWALGVLIIDEARAELAKRYAEVPSAPGVRETVRRLASFFGAAKDPDDVLYWPLQAVRVSALTADRKIAYLRSLLASASRLRRKDANLGARAVRELQEALLDWGAVNEAVAVTIITEVSGSQVNPEIYGYARSWLADKARNPDQELLTVLASLGDRVPSGSPELADLADGNRKLTRFLDITSGDKIHEQRMRSTAIKLVCEASPAVVRLRADEVVEALSRDPDLAADTFARFPARGKQSPVGALIALAGTRFGELKDPEDRVQCALWLFHIYTHPDMPSRRREMVAREIRQFPSVISAASGGKSADKWRAEVGERLGRDGLRDQWEALFPRHGGLTWTFRS